MQRATAQRPSAQPQAAASPCVPPPGTAPALPAPHSSVTEPHLPELQPTEGQTLPQRRKVTNQGSVGVHKPPPATELTSPLSRGTDCAPGNTPGCCVMEAAQPGAALGRWPSSLSLLTSHASYGVCAEAGPFGGSFWHICKTWELPPSPKQHDGAGDTARSLPAPFFPPASLATSQVSPRILCPSVCDDQRWFRRRVSCQPSQSLRLGSRTPVPLALCGSSSPGRYF